MTDTADVLNEITIDIDQVPEGTNLVALIGTAARDAEPDWGTSWVLTATGGMPQLVVGVRGERGALAWYEPAETVPAHGLNHEPADYSLADMHHTPMPPGSELPIAEVLTAVSEFIRTGQRPTCVQWREFDPFKP